MNLVHESHSIVPPDPDLDKCQRLGLGLLGLGLALFFTALFRVFRADQNTFMFYITIGLIVVGGLTYSLRTHLKRPAGIQNNNITRASITARGAAGWLVGVLLTALYTIYYWGDFETFKTLGIQIKHAHIAEGLVRLFDPLSELLRKRPADQWFLYGAIYTLAVLIMGAKAIAKYRHSRYQIIRTCSIIFCQLILAFIVPTWMERLNQPYFAPSYFWPLSYQNLFPGKVEELTVKGGIGMFILGWGIIMLVIATPVFTYFYGKRWYCSWVCGCGGLSNTAGDSWRQLSDKSLKAWKLERITIYSVLILIILTTAALWYHSSTGAMANFASGLKKFYGFVIGAAFSGVIGVGFYPILGTRVWCRFGCPQAAILGIIQRFKSRFRITTNGAQCISCGNCSKYCEMGIDVRWYAQRGQDIVRASCVGCGICSTVCPRGVLSLENGPIDLRKEYEFDLLGSAKARKLESQNRVAK